MKMRQLNTILLTIALIACQCCNAASLAGPQSVARMSLSSSSRFVTALQGGGKGSIDEATVKDYSGDAAALFGNLRVPAALFAGASAGAAFAMPIGSADSAVVGAVKRAYALLMIGALSCQIIAVVVATLAMGSITTSSSISRNAASISEYLNGNLDFEWVTARFNFLMGILMFVMGSGLRAWVSIACPVMAKGALGIIVSATCLAIGFINRVEVGSGGGLVRLFTKFQRLSFEHVRKDPFFAMAYICSAITWIYISVNVPNYLQNML